MRRPATTAATLWLQFRFVASLAGWPAGRACSFCAGSGSQPECLGDESRPILLKGSTLSLPYVLAGFQNSARQEGQLSIDRAAPALGPSPHHKPAGCRASAPSTGAKRQGKRLGWGMARRATATALLPSFVLRTFKRTQTGSTTPDDWLADPAVQPHSQQLSWLACPVSAHPPTCRSRRPLQPRDRGGPEAPEHVPLSGPDCDASVSRSSRPHGPGATVAQRHALGPPSLGLNFCASLRRRLAPLRTSPNTRPAAPPPQLRRGKGAAVLEGEGFRDVPDQGSNGGSAVSGRARCHDSGRAVTHLFFGRRDALRL